jgi:glutamate synthase domain-containing protein 2
MKLKHLAGALTVGVGAIAIRDLTQTKHALRRNFPVIGNARYLLERIGPELRQYIVTGNDEERPFSRDQRDWIYESAKAVNNYQGFGTDNDVEHTVGYPIIKHRAFPESLPHDHAKETGLPAAKVMGGPRGRAKAYRPPSIINISGTSYGSMSGPAIEALNRGARDANCWHNTGEGGLSDHHRQGADLVFQVGTGYFGCRNPDGSFSMDKLVETVESAPVRAIEIKLSQGAKAGLGGLLPGVKVSAEIARIRGIEAGVDCASPSRHSAFGDEDSLLDFVESIAAETGLPVGIKSAVGDLAFWRRLAVLMQSRERGVDFVTIDGGEGGTGAAPPTFADAVSLPFRMGFSRVYATFAEAGLTDDVYFAGSGKLGLIDNAVAAFALGVDSINVARETMLAIGCIQSQKCHTDKCPTGVATQNPWLTRGLEPVSKGGRCANYLKEFRKEMVKMVEAVGVAHPGLITPDDVEIMTGDFESKRIGEIYGYRPEWGRLGPELATEITRLMTLPEPVRS